MTTDEPTEDPAVEPSAEPAPEPAIDPARTVAGSDAATGPATKALPVAEARKPHRGGRVVSAVLLALTFILTPIAMSATWVRFVVVSENQYVNAVSPLATDPQVVDALEDRLTDAVMTQIDNLNISDQVTAFLVGKGVPARVAGAAATALSSLNGTVQGLVQRASEAILTSQQFRGIWDRINRVAHNQLVEIMKGDSRLIDQTGAVSLQLQPLVAAVRQNLVDRGMGWASKIPDSDKTFVLLSASDTQQLQRIYKLSTIIVWAALILTLLLIVAVIVLAVDRWRAVRRAALAVVFGVLLLGGALRIVENRVVDASANAGARHPEAVASIVDAVVNGLRAAIQVTAIICVVAIIVSLIAGSDTTAQSMRDWLFRLKDKWGDPRYSTRNRAIAGVIAAIAGGVLIFVNMSADLAFILLFVIVIAAVLLVIPTTSPTAPAAADLPPLTAGS